MNSKLKKLLAKKQRKPSFQERLIFSDLGALILVQALWAWPSPQYHPSPQMLATWLKWCSGHQLATTNLMEWFLSLQIINALGIKMSRIIWADHSNLQSSRPCRVYTLLLSICLWVSNRTPGTTKKTSAELKFSISFFWSFHRQATFEAAKWVTILSIAVTWIPAKSRLAPCPCHVLAYFTRLGWFLWCRAVNNVTCSQSCW